MGRAKRILGEQTSWTRISTPHRGLSLPVCRLLALPAPVLPRGTENPPGRGPGQRWGCSAPGQRPECHRPGCELPGTGRWQVAVCERQRWDVRGLEENYPDTRMAFPSVGSLGESFRLLALLSDIILVLLGVSQCRDRNRGS